MTGTIPLKHRAQKTTSVYPGDSISFHVIISRFYRSAVCESFPISFHYLVFPIQFNRCDATL